MTLLQIFGIVLVVVGVPALLFLTPKGGRKVENTRAMTAARITLVVILLIVAAAAFL